MKPKLPKRSTIVWFDPKQKLPRKREPLLLRMDTHIGTGYYFPRGVWRSELGSTYYRPVLRWAYLPK